ncbi:hypothetical protein OGATHE_005103 [Ogataea polymorpha]|uniref:Uncharacterized protein n=1 Tax=Ogataea polymorpha TaxID=460523 RepID=A0A9P8T0M8_9ASCO|nr:hypothetical protein OGATHE_005103 [Ogataea polymorpha]
MLGSGTSPTRSCSSSSRFSRFSNRNGVGFVALIRTTMLISNLASAPQKRLKSWLVDSNKLFVTSGFSLGGPRVNAYDSHASSTMYMNCVDLTILNGTLTLRYTADNDTN